MDPEENIKEQIQIAHAVLDGAFFEGDVIRLAELVLSLDEWIKKGGFLPSCWQITRVDSKRILE